MKNVVQMQMQGEILFSCLWCHGSRGSLSLQLSCQNIMWKYQTSWSAAISVFLGLTVLDVWQDLVHSVFREKFEQAAKRLLNTLQLYIFPRVVFIFVIIMQKLTLENRWLEISLYNQIYMSHKDNQRLYF